MQFQNRDLLGYIKIGIIHWKKCGLETLKHIGNMKIRLETKKSIGNIVMRLEIKKSRLET